MSALGRHDVTDLLLEWNRGQKAALDRLMPLVTDELRRLAKHYLRGEKAEHTLQPTALVNEVYLRLVDRRRVSWENRAHFFAFAATTMRRVLVDYARAKRTAKRGSGVTVLPLDEALAVSPATGGVDLLLLDSALSRLSRLDPRQGKLVELRFFAGLTLAETAEVLGISEATVSRDWTSARAFLFRELSGERPPADPAQPASR